MTGSMMSQEYSHQVSLARMPNWVAMYAMPPHSTQVVRRSAFLLSSSLTCANRHPDRETDRTSHEEACFFPPNVPKGRGEETMTLALKKLLLYYWDHFFKFCRLD